MSIFGDIWDKVTGSNGTDGTVDIEAMLDNLAAQRSDPGDWRTSIVDLLNLLDMDSSLHARMELADELDVHVGGDGTAEQNIALHQALIQKLQASGGEVPDDLKC